MAAEQAGKRVRIEAGGERLVITIRGGVVRGTVALALILIVADLALAFLPGHYLLEDYRTRGDVAYLVMDWAFLVLVAGAGIFAARMGARALGSREIIRVDRHELSLRRGALLLSPPARFRIRCVRRLRALPEALFRADRRGPDPWRSVEGRNVVFEYGPRTVRFGLRLSEEDAQRVAAAIAQRFEATLSECPEADGDAPQTKAPLPPAPRMTIRQGPEGRQITIPAPRSRLFAFTYGSAFVASLAMVIFASIGNRQPGSGVHVNPLDLICLALAFGLARRMMWSLYGREELFVGRNGAMTIVRDHGLLRRRFAFDLRHVTGIGISLQSGPASAADLGLLRGNVWFEYRDGGRPVLYRFGVGLQEGEAVAVASLLAQERRAVQGGATTEESL